MVLDHPPPGLCDGEHTPLFTNARDLPFEAGVDRGFPCAAVPHAHPQEDSASLTMSCNYLEITAPDKLRLLEDEEEMLPGIRAFWTGRPSPLLDGLCDRLWPRGSVVVSDCFFKYRNVENMIPLGIMESLEECMRRIYQHQKEAERPPTAVRSALECLAGSSPEEGTKGEPAMKERTAVRDRLGERWRS